MFRRSYNVRDMLVPPRGSLAWVTMRSIKCTAEILQERYRHRCHLHHRRRHRRRRRVHAGYSAGIIKCRTFFAPRVFVLSAFATFSRVFLAFHIARENRFIPISICRAILTRGCIRFSNMFW